VAGAQAANIMEATINMIIAKYSFFMYFFSSFENLDVCLLCDRGMDICLGASLVGEKWPGSQQNDCQVLPGNKLYNLLLLTGIDYINKSR
jgi:hypothetical protein